MWWNAVPEIEDTRKEAKQNEREIKRVRERGEEKVRIDSSANSEAKYDDY